jgi:hypothetical protein
MKKILPAMIAGVVLALARPAGSAVPPAEKLLPDDTLAFVSVPDFAQARNIYSNSPQGRLWQDASMKAFKTKFMNKLTATLLAPLEKDLGIHLEDYAALPQGQFTVAVTQNGWDGAGDFFAATDGLLSGASDGKLPGLVLLVDTQAQSSQLKTNLADLKKRLLDAGRTVRTEKIREVEFSVINLSTNTQPKSLQSAASAPEEAAGDAEAPKPALKRELYIGQADSLLLLGGSPKTLEKILARLSGAEVKTVGEVPAYEANSPMFRGAAAFGWVNAKAMLGMLSHNLEHAPADGEAAADSLVPKPGKVLAASGLAGLKSLAFSQRYAEDGLHSEFLIGVPEAGRAGLFKLLAGEARETGPPAFVPADAIKYQRWRVDGQKGWATLQQMIGDLSPQYRNTLDFWFNTVEAGAKEKDPGFDLKRNLFGNLGDDLIIYAKAPKAASAADPGAPPTLYLIGSPNAEQLAGTVRALVPMLNPQGTDAKEREFLGKKIYSLPLPLGGGGSLNYACSGGYLAITTDAAMLEEYLRSGQAEGKALRDTPGLGEALQKAGGSGSSMAGFSNDSEAMRLAWEGLKKGLVPVTGSVGPLLALLGMGDENLLKDWVDVSLLPGYDKISKYFSFTVYAETPTAEGLSFKTFTPLPPQLKQ